MTSTFIVSQTKLWKRKNRMRSLFIMFIFIAFSNSYSQTDSTEVTASEVTDSLASFSVNLLSLPDNAEVYNDTVLIGATPVLNYQMKEGNYKLKFVNPGSGKFWQNSNQIIDLHLKADTTISAAFRYFYYFDSDPFNASVISNDTLLGLTPLRLLNEYKITGNIIFRKENYQDLVFNISDYDFGTGLKVNMRSKGKIRTNDEVYKDKGTQFNTSRNLPVISGLGAVSIAAGFFTYNFKKKGNSAYDEYLLTGSQEKLDESKENDTYFVISLVLMQAALGGLIYFLFFD